MGAMMGKPSKSQADGAKIPVRLALGDISNSTGEFWENDSISSPADGKISVW
jgi:carbonyl reductase 1